MLCGECGKVWERVGEGGEMCGECGMVWEVAALKYSGIFTSVTHH